VESGSAAQLFLSQYYEFGGKLPLLGTTLAADMPDQILSQLGDSVIGLKGQALYMTSLDNAVNKKWVKEMTKRFGQTPGGLEANSYAITRAILTALQATGGNDSYDNLWPALKKVKLNTPQGPLAVSSEGVALVDNYIVELKKKDGKFYWDPIKTYRAVEDPRLKK
jgi:branched-chain amino acid transport system substrate-binding protein